MTNLCVENTTAVFGLMLTIIGLCIFISAVAIFISEKDKAAARKYMSDYSNEGISPKEVNTP